jgi:hypothetical protein
MWTLFGEQADEWLQSKVGFIVNSDHLILIEAKIAHPEEGDVAIDDIAITNGYCITQPTFAQPDSGPTTPTTVPTTQMFVCPLCSTQLSSTTLTTTVATQLSSTTLTTTVATQLSSTMLTTTVATEHSAATNTFCTQLFTIFLSVMFTYSNN